MRRTNLAPSPEEVEGAVYSLRRIGAGYVGKPLRTVWRLGEIGRL